MALYTYGDHIFALKRSKGAGLGLFAETPIKKDDFIIEYIGEHISTEESDRRGGKYLFTLSKDTVVDGKQRDNLARYINHSCVPNCEVEIDEDEEEINVYALRDIKSGEELTYDYGKEYWDDHIKKEKCACPKCTKRRKKRRKKS